MSVWFSFGMVKIRENVIIGRKDSPEVTFYATNLTYIDPGPPC